MGGGRGGRRRGSEFHMPPAPALRNHHTRTQHNIMDGAWRHGSQTSITTRRSREALKNECFRIVARIAKPIEKSTQNRLGLQRVNDMFNTCEANTSLSS